MEKTPVYFMPGLAAGPLIFEHIHLPEDAFDIFILEWLIPIKNESIEAYALRMTEKIMHKRPVLIGVSFGGILVQEMAKIIDTKKVIIISSVKSNTELPLRMKVLKKTMAYKLIPTKLIANIELLVKYAFGDNIVANRLKLYEKYLSVRDKQYLDWAIENVIIWKQTEPSLNIVHIHGEKDRVFPVENIKNYISIKNGSHVMILNKFKWFNENLPKIIN
jgi:pimeloyl-ACP methyl ester carboxylesterase